MDWAAFALSLRLAAATTTLLLPIGLLLGRALARRKPGGGRGLVEAAVALPLVLPPSVLGYYLLVAFGAASPVGGAYEAVVGHPLVFTFDGLLLASIIFSLPFAVQPMQRAFEAVPRDVREAAWCSGLSPLATLLRIELPLAW